MSLQGNFGSEPTDGSWDTGGVCKKHSRRTAAMAVKVQGDSSSCTRPEL